MSYGEMATQVFGRKVHFLTASDWTGEWKVFLVPRQAIKLPTVWNQGTKRR